MASKKAKLNAALLTLQQVQAMLEDPDHDKYTDEELKTTRDNLIKYVKNARSD